MREYSYFSFLKKSDSGSGISPVNLVHGYNEFLGERIIKTLIKKFLGEKSNFNFKRYYFDSEESEDWFEIISEVKSSKFFIESRKVIAVVIRKDRYLSISREEVNLIKNYLLKPNFNAVLVVYISLDMLKDEYKQLNKTKISKFLKYFDADFTVSVNLDKINESDVKEYIRNELKRAIDWKKKI